MKAAARAGGRLPAVAAGAAVGALTLLGCHRRMISVSSGSIEGGPRRAAVRSASDQVIRVSVSSGAESLRIAGGDFRISTRAGDDLVAHGGRDESWRVERDGDRLRAVRPDGVPTVWTTGGLVVRAAAVDGEGDELLRVNGRRYRGELLLLPSGTGIVAVNRLRMDDYLKGVVPLEIGTRSEEDLAAMEAQAVAARSYAYVRLGEATAARPFDVTSGIDDQVYGGADAETAPSSRAVDETRGLVLQYGGRVVNAPYHSTCGGSTAAATEIWRSNGEPYLQSVSDRIPGTDRYYCDISPRFRWTRTLTSAELRAALERYLGAYTSVPGGKPGVPQALAVDTRTPSGRVGTLAIATDRGNYVLRGNDIRYVLRRPGGEILNSTYFSVETATGRDGSITRLTLHGTGYGHGVGMCQWGAIGRARAGQDFRTILGTYYPGTTVGPVE